MHQWFHIRFTRPNDWTYELWPQAADAVEAVKTADAMLEYVERVGISDYLEPDGISVRGGATLLISRVDEPPAADLHLRIIRPDGTVVEK